MNQWVGSGDVTRAGELKGGKGRGPYAGLCRRGWGLWPRPAYGGRLLIPTGTGDDYLPIVYQRPTWTRPWTHSSSPVGNNRRRPLTVHEIPTRSVHLRAEKLATMAPLCFWLLLRKPSHLTFGFREIIRITKEPQTSFITPTTADNCTHLISMIITTLIITALNSFLNAKGTFTGQTPQWILLGPAPYSPPTLSDRHRHLLVKNGRKQLLDDRLKQQHQHQHQHRHWSEESIST